MLDNLREKNSHDRAVSWEGCWECKGEWRRGGVEREGKGRKVALTDGRLWCWVSAVLGQAGKQRPARRARGGDEALSIFSGDKVKLPSSGGCRGAGNSHGEWRENIASQHRLQSGSQGHLRSLGWGPLSLIIRLPPSLPHPSSLSLLPTLLPTTCRS